MFPFDMEEEIETELPEDKLPIDYEIDFINGRLTGRLVTGLEAIKQWVRIVLSTDRYYFTQYSWNHGHELTELIGKRYSEEYIKSEAKRMIVDALLVNENITSVNDIEVEVFSDKISAKFRIETIYGGDEINV